MKRRSATVAGTNPGKPDAHGPAALPANMHRYRLIEAVRCDVPLEILLSVGRFDPARLQLNGAAVHSGHGSTRSHDNHQVHAPKFSTWSFETDRPLSLEALRKTASTLPVNVYRAKGVVYTSDVPQRRAVLQVVGKRVDISLQDEWGKRPPRTQIVTIGAPEGIDAGVLRDRFEQCLSG